MRMMNDDDNPSAVSLLYIATTWTLLNLVTFVIRIGMLSESRQVCLSFSITPFRTVCFLEAARLFGFALISFFSVERAVAAWALIFESSFWACIQTGPTSL